ncbi:MAG: nitroreductase family protein [Methanotrichaceae archaeon]|nr:nitroreductase family protein [Methanotrichaceae archaeon]
MLDLLRARRSIRRYKDEGIDPLVIEKLREAAVRSPTSRGINPWRFIFVADKPLLDDLSRAKEGGSGFLKGAGLGVVVCAEEEKSDVWVEDCSISAIILQLTALSLGLGSCWIQIRNRMHSPTRSSEEYVREILGLPETMRVECIISLGYPAETKSPVPAKDLEFEKILSL